MVFPDTIEQGGHTMVKVSESGGVVCYRVGDAVCGVKYVGPVSDNLVKLLAGHMARSAAEGCK